MNQIAVSVIMPSLNVVTYIEKCVESVRRQTLKNIEIICVDAGSTDGTLEILRNFEKKDSRIKVILSDKKSYGYQVNLGIKAAKGDFIGIVETDDYIEENFYEKLYEKAKDSDVDFVKMGFREYFRYDDRDIYYNKISKAAVDIADKFIDLWENPSLKMIELNHIWSGIYRKKFLVENKIWLNETAGASYQDTSFSILVALIARRCTYLNECLYNYQINNPASSVKSSEKWDCIIEEYRYIEDYLKKNRLYTKENILLVLEAKMETYLWNYMRLGDVWRELFMAKIEDEVQGIYSDKEIWDHLSEEAKEKWRLLTTPQRLVSYERKQSHAYDIYKEIINNARSGKKYVVLCAGKCFKELCFWQRVLGIEFVEAVCDNAEFIQGTMVEGYAVKRVHDIVEGGNPHDWIIANANHYDSLMEQLVSKGVEQERIIVFNKMLAHQKLIDILA